MNNLQPEERRAKADEIARLLENDPFLIRDLKDLLSPRLINELGDGCSVAAVKSKARSLISEIEDAISEMKDSINGMEDEFSE